MSEKEKLSEKETKTNTFTWTRESIKDLEEFIEHLADKYLVYKRDMKEAERKYWETVSKHNRRMAYSLVLFLIAIVLGMSYLTLSGRVTGDALLFLVGTITGYVLLFIQRLIFTGREAAAEEEQID